MRTALHLLGWWLLAALFAGPLIGLAIETPDEDELPPPEPLNPRGRRR